MATAQEENVLKIILCFVQAIFASCDKNSAGKVSLEELQKAKINAKARRDKIVKTRSLTSFFGKEPQPEPELQGSVRMPEMVLGALSGWLQRALQVDGE